MSCVIEVKARMLINQEQLARQPLWRLICCRVTPPALGVRQSVNTCLSNSQDVNACTTDETKRPSVRGLRSVVSLARVSSLGPAPSGPDFPCGRRLFRRQRSDMRSRRVLLQQSALEDAQPQSAGTASRTLSESVVFADAFTPQKPVHGLKEVQPVCVIPTLGADTRLPYPLAYTTVRC